MAKKVAAPAPSPMPSFPAPGNWIVASRVLGRPVGDDVRYPHVCGLSKVGGREVRLYGKECHRCAEDKAVSAGG